LAAGIGLACVAIRRDEAATARSHKIRMLNEEISGFSN
jgi:hypothetical protein